MSVYYRTNEMRISEFAKQTDEIFYDESFQRPSGCWNKSNYNGYIEGVYMGINSTPIVVADIEKCRRHSQKINDEISEDYFAKWSKRGMSYISLDGQHRAICIEDFLNNKISFTGIAVNDDGVMTKVTNRYFKDLEYSYQISFKNKTIVFQQYERARRSDLPRVFKSLNSNSALTDQQKRNAIQTPFATWIREISKKLKKSLEKIFPKNSFQKMRPHEYISKLFMHIENDSCDVGKNALDSYYEKGEGDKFENVYSVPAQKKTERILNSLDFLISNINEKSIGNNNLISISLVLDMLHLEPEFNIETFSADQFVSLVELADQNLIAASEEQKVLDRKSDKQKSEVSYYHEKKRLNWNSATRKSRQTILFEEFKRIRLQKLTEVA